MLRNSRIKKNTINQASDDTLDGLLYFHFFVADQSCDESALALVFENMAVDNCGYCH